MSQYARELFKDSPLSISQGQVAGHSAVSKFGYNPDVGVTKESVWSAGGLYPWSALTTAQTLYLISTDAGDTGVVQVQGLDENYVLQTEEVTLTGLTAATTTNTFLRVFRMIYLGSVDNVGTITARVTSGTGTIVSQIDAGYNQTLVGIYTVPAGYWAYITSVSVSGTKDQAIEFEGWHRPVGQTFRIAHKAEASLSYRYDFTLPLRFPEKTDFDTRVIAGAANTKISVNFDMILVEDYADNP